MFWRRQALTMFIESFSTYTGLLSKIQVFSCCLFHLKEKIKARDWTLNILLLAHLPPLRPLSRNCCISDMLSHCYVLLVQAEFEAALDQGLHCTMENVEMRLRIYEEEQKRNKAVGDLRSKMMESECCCNHFMDVSQVRDDAQYHQFVSSLIQYESCEFHYMCNWFVHVLTSVCCVMIIGINLFSF
jgi:hypothetical protein